MGSVGDGGCGEVLKMKGMWLYPRVMGFNPSERWGHSACFYNGFVYIFGGCCGGLHLSDVLVLNLETMAWNNVATTGLGPGPRDSHSAVIVAHMMIVFGGTNGSKKVNDLHVLDLLTREWTRPICKGAPPSLRESHTATVVGEDRLVIFGGSGEGDANYLNDLHVLNLNSMRWTSPEVKGDIPVPRDSHSAVAVNNKVFVYGGDCGDRYLGDVDVLDLDTFTWSRVVVQGPSPGSRAGHAAVTIGTKLYVVGGVGEKQYYNDIWALDTSTSYWTRLEIQGQQPQGRFSHTAIITGSDIIIYGGCGEDERPLNELLILQLGAENPNGRYAISMCKIFGRQCNHDKRRFLREPQTNTKPMFLGGVMDISRKDVHEAESQMKHSLPFSSDPMHSKRRRMSNPKACELIESEAEEHSLSLSQHSSPSHSDHDNPSAVNQVLPFFKHQNQVSSNCKQSLSSQLNPIKIVHGTPQDPRFFQEQQKHRQLGHGNGSGSHDLQFPVAERKYFQPLPVQNLMGAEVRGKVDGAFDSGYLMTATVNGRIFRGVLFPPGPEVVSRSTNLGQNRPSPASHDAQTNLNIYRRFIRQSLRPTTPHPSEPSHHSRHHEGQDRQSSPAIRPAPSLSLGREQSSIRNELQGVVLTLGPGNGHGGS